MSYCQQYRSRYICRSARFSEPRTESLGTASALRCRLTRELGKLATWFDQPRGATMRVNRSVRLSALAIAFAAVANVQPGLAQTPIKFLLAWTYEPPTSAWTLAQTSGCFKRNGLDVTIDGGRGSGDTLSKVATGAYDIGIAHFST